MTRVLPFILVIKQHTAIVKKSVPPLSCSRARLLHTVGRQHHLCCVPTCPLLVRSSALHSTVDRNSDGSAGSVSFLQLAIHGSKFGGLKQGLAGFRSMFIYYDQIEVDPPISFCSTTLSICSCLISNAGYRLQHRSVDSDSRGVSLL